MLNSTSMRKVMRLIGAAAVSGALSAGLLATPVSAGAADGSKKTYTTKSRINSISSKPKTETSGKRINSIQFDGVGTVQTAAAKSESYGKRRINSI